MEFIYKNGYLEDLRPRIEKMLKISEECGWDFQILYMISTININREMNTTLVH